jgi:GNAT superfamily N-acetyltransferase
MDAQRDRLTLFSRSGRRVEVELARCAPEQLSAILALQEEVAREMESAELFARTTEEELRESLALDWCLAVLLDGKPAAFTLMVVNRVTPRSIGTYLDYDEARLKKCVTYDTTFVRSDLRGLGLQRELGRLKDEAALALGAEEALSTISPQNSHSLKNALARGFEICAERELYGGVRRYIMRKKL